MRIDHAHNFISLRFENPIEHMGAIVNFIFTILFLPLIAATAIIQCKKSPSHEKTPEKTVNASMSKTSRSPKNLTPTNSAKTAKKKDKEQKSQYAAKCLAEEWGLNGETKNEEEAATDLGSIKENNPLERKFKTAMQDDDLLNHKSNRSKKRNDSQRKQRKKNTPIKILKEKVGSLRGVNGSGSKRRGLSKERAETQESDRSQRHIDAGPNRLPANSNEGLQKKNKEIIKERNIQTTITQITEDQPQIRRSGTPVRDNNEKLLYSLDPSHQNMYGPTATPPRGALLTTGVPAEKQDAKLIATPANQQKKDDSVRVIGSFNVKPAKKESDYLMLP